MSSFDKVHSVFYPERMELGMSPSYQDTFSKHLYVHLQLQRASVLSDDQKKESVFLFLISCLTINLFIEHSFRQCSSVYLSKNASFPVFVQLEYGIPSFVVVCFTLFKEQFIYKTENYSSDN